MRRPPAALAAPLAAGLLACGSGDPASPAGACRASPPMVSLQPLAAAVVRSEETGACFRLGGAGAHYLIVPQFAAEGSGTERSTFSLTASLPVAGGMVASRSVGAQSDPTPAGANHLQGEFDRALRERERGLPAGAGTSAPAGGARLSRTATAALDSVRDFQVLEKLDGDKFTSVRAALRYTGTNVAVYLDVAAPGGGFTADELRRFGDLFDQTLYGIDVAAFGRPSDIDNNARVLVVITPRVNALTAASRCSVDGFISGYFYGVDLSPGQTGSNKGELFYTVAPDPAATVSCAHSVTQVAALAPATFIHEFQHMISYNQHKLERRGRDEAVWLNEGLSHIAEELGSLHYETRYPAPLGRQNPAQLFPDSSQAFLVPNLTNAFDYLASSRDQSVTSFHDFGTLEERGAAWLFLRWLGDQKGSGIFQKLEATTQTGAENVAAAAGEPFGRLLADFGVAVWTDSLPGQPRSAVPARYRFTSRNLRAIFGRLNATGGASTAFPVKLTDLGGAGALSRDMRPGTMDFFEVRLPAESASVQVRFAPGSSDVGFRSALAAQIAVFRLPE